MVACGYFVTFIWMFIAWEHMGKVPHHHTFRLSMPCIGPAACSSENQRHEKTDTNY